MATARRVVDGGLLALVHQRRREALISVGAGPTVLDQLKQSDGLFVLISGVLDQMAKTLISHVAYAEVAGRAGLPWVGMMRTQGWDLSHGDSSLISTRLAPARLNGRRVPE